MSSVERAPAQIPANKLYITVGNCSSTIYTATGTLVPWFSTTGLNLSTAGAAVFRDMGKTVYLPDPTVASSSGSISTVLRKVQLVTNQPVGTGANADSAAAGAAGEYYTGYVMLPGNTYGGGGATTGSAAGSATLVARLN